MRSGKLSSSITVERQIETVKPSGAVTKSWQPLITVCADVRQPTSDEYLAGYGEGTADRAIFLIRHIHGVPVTTADRVVWLGKTYGITGISILGRQRWQELRAVAAA